jgi:hypothetical protein
MRGRRDEPPEIVNEEARGRYVRYMERMKKKKEREE